MSISYDTFTDAFLAKITEFDLLDIASEQRDEIVAGYMRRAVAHFKHICHVDLTACENKEERRYDTDENFSDEDVDELVDIVSEGMVVQWLKPYIYKQELLENVLNTRDYSTYSPANLLFRVRETYQKVQSDYTQMMREYSYNHGDLTVLHI